MRFLRPVILILSLAASSSEWVVPALAAKAIPAPPEYYVLDEPGIITPEVKRSLQTLLIEHDRLTSEQVLIAVFSSLDGEDLLDFTNRVFKQWGIGSKNKNNGVLLALYWQDKKIRIEVGYGLEPILTDAKTEGIISDFLTPELKAGDPSRALTLAAFEILRTLESPLIASGQARQILESGGYRGDFSADRPTRAPRSGGVAFFLIIGIALIFIVLNMLTSAGAHYTRNGWYRPSPWRRRTGGWWGGGGGFGGGGGGGGFLGGGGRSGGGGASGSW